MIGFFEQFNRTFAGLRLDPDHAVVGEMLAEKYGIRFLEGGDQIELHYLSRPLRETAAPRKKTAPGRKPGTQWAVWPARSKRYNASMCVRFLPGQEDVIRSVYMKHWVETENGCEPAYTLMTDEEFLRGIAILQEYLDRVAVKGTVADCRWPESA